MALKRYDTFLEGQMPDGTEDDQVQTGDVQPMQSMGPSPYQEVTPERRDEPPTQRPRLSQGGASGQPVQIKTFAQMQEEGLARPPQPTMMNMGGGASMSIAPSDIPPITPPTVGTGATLRPTMTTQQWVDYSPFTGMTEEQKAQYWDAQFEKAGMKGVSGGGQTGVFNDPATGKPDLAANIARQTASANDPRTAALIAEVQAAQAAALDQVNAGNAEYNRQTAQDDARNYIDSIKRAGGVYNPGDEDKAFQEFMRRAGFAADGTYTPETEANPIQNNPNATPGFPSNYDPNAPIQPNNGYVDDQGNYHTEQGPPRYLINGQWYDNPQGKGQPLGQGPSSAGGSQVQGPPGQPAGGGGTTGTTGGGQGTNSTFDMLNELIKGAQGQGQGGQVQQATLDALMKLLQNPNPYGSQDVKDQYGWLGGQIDDEYSLRQQQLGEEMARRGLGYSTNYGGRLQDLNIGQRSGKISLAQDLAHQFAQNDSNARMGAIGLGNTVGTQAQNNQQSWLAQLMGYGQQAFNNDLATNAMNQNAAQQWQNYILALLGYGGGG